MDSQHDTRAPGDINTGRPGGHQAAPKTTARGWFLPGRLVAVGVVAACGNTGRPSTGEPGRGASGSDAHSRSARSVQYFDAAACAALDLDGTPLTRIHTEVDLREDVSTCGLSPSDVKALCAIARGASSAPLIAGTPWTIVVGISRSRRHDPSRSRRHDLIPRDHVVTT